MKTTKTNRATIKLSNGFLLLELSKLELEPRTDVWLDTASGRTTLFCQFSETEEKEIELVESVGFEPLFADRNDMWQGGRIVRFYADIPKGREKDYEIFRR